MILHCFVNKNQAKYNGILVDSNIICRHVAGCVVVSWYGVWLGSGERGDAGRLSRIAIGPWLIPIDPQKSSCCEATKLHAELV